MRVEGPRRKRGLFHSEFVALLKLIREDIEAEDREGEGQGVARLPSVERNRREERVHEQLRELHLRYATRGRISFLVDYRVSKKKQNPTYLRRFRSK